MTYRAILNASDEQLKNDLNLSKLGERLSLRAFCKRRTNLDNTTDHEEESREARKRRLLQELEKKRKAKVHSKESAAHTGKRVVTYKNTKVTRKVDLAWLHKTSGNMKLVRLKDGGGTRVVDIPKSATKADVIEMAKNLFLNDGNCIFGPLEQLRFNLLTFNKEPIDDKDVPFTLQAYIDNFKLSKIRLYLCTEIREDEDEHSDDLLESDSDQDNFVNISMYDDAHLQTRIEEPDIPHEDHLIGSSRQRQELKECIDKAYEESLAADQAKSPADVVVVDENEHHQKRNKDVFDLRKTRNERLPKEPCASEPHYIVSVRHLSLGALTRMFSLDDCAYSIYDWIGSLTDSPQHFQLCTYSGQCVSPSENIKSFDKCMLVMVPSMDPIAFSPNETVSLRGFGSRWEIDPITDYVPCNIMQQDDEEKHDNDSDDES